MKKVTSILIGAGLRGGYVYSQYALDHPDEFKVVAVAEPDQERRKLFAAKHNIPKELQYESYEELLQQDKMADCAMICTQDKMHYEPVTMAMQKGYHVLCEKPMSPDKEEIIKMGAMAKKYDRILSVCHVLRYSPFFSKIKEILEEGRIGRMMSIQHIEEVGYWHHAHSFVRGNWRNKEESSPMILQKCCHDMDLYLWLADKKCKSLSSFGSTYLFKEENAPEGCTKRCLDGCKVKATCPYDAESIYLDSERIGARNGNTRWPLDVVTEIPTPESVEEALKTGPYGRCVYHCDNDVVDHQVVNLNMTDGSTMSFSMNGHTADFARHAQFCGTKGEMNVTMGSWDVEDDFIETTLFGAKLKTELIPASELSDDFSGHGGGDIVMVEEFVDILLGNREESPSITSLEKSVESHYCALAAEESRLHGGAVIELDDIRQKGSM